MEAWARLPAGLTETEGRWTGTRCRRHCCFVTAGRRASRVSAFPADHRGRGSGSEDPVQVLGAAGHLGTQPGTWAGYQGKDAEAAGRSQGRQGIVGDLPGGRSVRTEGHGHLVLVTSGHRGPSAGDLEDQDHQDHLQEVRAGEASQGVPTGSSVGPHLAETDRDGCKEPKEIIRTCKRMKLLRKEQSLPIHRRIHEASEPEYRHADPIHPPWTD